MIMRWKSLTSMSVGDIVSCHALADMPKYHCSKHNLHWSNLWVTSSTQIANTLGSTLIRHRSDTEVSDRCLIDVDPRVLAIWVARQCVVWFTELLQNCSDNSAKQVFPLLHKKHEIWAWISKKSYCFMWDIIHYPCLNFKVGQLKCVQVMAWMNSYIPHFDVYVILDFSWRTKSIPWLLMPWLLVLLEHHSTCPCLPWGKISIVPFHKDFSPSGEQLELHKLAHQL